MTLMGSGVVLKVFSLIDCTSNKELITCPECKEFIDNDNIDDKLEEAQDAYDT